MSDVTSLHDSLVASALDGKGEASLEMRRAAFNNEGLAEPIGQFVDKVAHNARMVTDEDIAAMLGVGLSEDQIYEIVICAAIGQADRQYRNGLAALNAATGSK